MAAVQVSDPERHPTQPRDRQHPARDSWSVDPLPTTQQASDDPTKALSRGAKSVLNALRARPFGATAAKLAELAGVSYSQTLRCLAGLEQRGWAERTATQVHIGYELRPATLWALSWSDGCMRALSYLRDRPTRPPAEPDDLVPQRFWRAFWSGTPADRLRISTDSLHIAVTLIGDHDPCGRAWALNALPTAALRECRSLRGFDRAPIADLLDTELARRAAAT